MDQINSGQIAHQVSRSFKEKNMLSKFTKLQQSRIPGISSLPVPQPIQFSFLRRGWAFSHRIIILLKLITTKEEKLHAHIKWKKCNYLEIQRNDKIICLKYSDFLGKSPFIICYNYLINLSFLCTVYRKARVETFSHSGSLPFLCHPPPMKVITVCLQVTSLSLKLLSLFLWKESDLYTLMSAEYCHCLPLYPVSALWVLQ